MFVTFQQTSDHFFSDFTSDHSEFVLMRAIHMPVDVIVQCDPKDFGEPQMSFHDPCPLAGLEVGNDSKKKWNTQW